MSAHTLSHFSKDVLDQRAWDATFDKYAINTDVFGAIKADGYETLLDFFEAHFTNRPHELAFSLANKDQGQHLTLADLNELSLSLATHLQILGQQLGLAKGDRIAVMMPNLLHYPVAMLAIIRAGYVLVNVNPLYTQRELQHQLNDSGAKILITHNPQADALACLPETSIKKLISIGKDLDFIQDNQTIVTDSQRYTRPNLTSQDVAMLQYTGGTTGIAKGAMLSHGGLLANLYQLDAVTGHLLDDQNDYILTALPLYHIFAFSVCMLYGLHRHLANLLVANPRDLPTLINTIKQYRPVVLPAVNTLFNAMLTSDDFKTMDHSHVKFCVGGGMAILPDTAKRWEEVVGKPIIEGCGLSEAGTVISVNPPAAGYTQSIGIPLPLTDIKLMNDDGEPVADGSSGEIWVKGPQLMLGYWGRMDDKESYMVDGYFKTGDVGVMDKAGFFKIIDRKKDVVNVSGFNVFPSEIESVYNTHPDIIECCAVGVPDEHSNEAVKLFVVIHPHKNITANELIDWGRQYLTAYKVPRRIAFIDQIPKSGVGKILRRKLIE
ncbi:AMP-binding protein [Moraxella catarrhalis]|uniref:Long-chain-fatty-acid--CoA ligase n=1 Tax=Moraxella catarrhalis TaxID=480 RepID=A0A198UG09_MORCA|nr:AMP-binding protein [Moraxella catarrhalis]OAU95038.1 Long-chain-fatty-acid--CoA ligase [Moraxella catarrhalis]OAU95356.1 Long-chain-fatty-acid--CoA ligase [Moraxella catarrhalis]OAU98262.1 Long-chain-fatty-acid--CoA ligase [Moraxella catarrhalis]